MAYLEKENLRSVLQDKGILQEANRTFFHPLGLALTIIYFEQTERTELKLQYTEHEEGFVFDSLDKIKRDIFRDFANDKYEKRQDYLGFLIQIQDMLDNDINVKRKTNIKTDRMEIIFKYLKEFIFSMQFRFMKEHQSKDFDNSFLSKEDLITKLNVNMIREDWASVANYAMIINCYDKLEKEISELVMEEEVIEND